MSKIEKSATHKKTLKRRRPNKKLVATLESLGDALDDIVAEGGVESNEQERAGKLRHKSLKSRPGALKKKEKIVKGEMERFGKSLAQLAAVREGQETRGMEVDEEKGGVEGGKEPQAQTQAAPSTANRWAALRGFISATMEQNPAFIPATGANR